MFYWIVCVFGFKQAFDCQSTKIDTVEAAVSSFKRLEVKTGKGSSDIHSFPYNSCDGAWGERNCHLMLNNIPTLLYPLGISLWCLPCLPRKESLHTCNLQCLVSQILLSWILFHNCSWLNQESRTANSWQWVDIFLVLKKDQMYFLLRIWPRK